MKYIAIDIETTGLRQKTDRIIEVGAVRMEDGTETAEMSFLIDPRMDIPERITELTGISEEMVDGQPPIGERIEEIVRFCEGLPLAGHHIITDFCFLKKAAVQAGLEFEHEGIDTLKLVRRCFPQLEKRGLCAVCTALGYPQAGKYHRALDDARAEAWLLEQILIQNSQIVPEITEKLVYKVKKEKTMTLRQKEDLIHLIKYHKIETRTDIDSLSRSEASRLIDVILSQYGRAGRRDR